MITSPAFRYHGAKFRLAPWLLGFFPPHTCYVEAFGGAAGVLLQKQRSYAEVYNDLDGELVNFFRVLQNDRTRDALIAALIHTPYARAEFERAWELAVNEIERARRLCIRAQMGFGSAGATKGSTGFRIDTKREYGTAQQLWTQYPETIAAVAQRMHGVLIENRPAIQVMQQHDGPQTLHYVDPTYLHSTRQMHFSKLGPYRYEMSDADHVDLLNALLALEGMAIVSGYDSELYNDILHGWQRHEKVARISAGRGTALRTEVIWINPAATEACNKLLF